MLAKWWWRFKLEKSGLWRRVVWAIHHKSRAWNDVPVKNAISGPWRGICSIDQPLLVANIDLKSAISAVVGNGQNTYFWLDNWVEPGPLYLLFPELFKEEVYKDCLVADRWIITSSGSAFNWAWSNGGLGQQAEIQLQQLLTILNNRTVSLAPDGWKWKYETNGYFSVASIKKVLSSVGRTRIDSVFEWNNWVPKKVGIVAWRAEMERLPTKSALARRNVPVSNRVCALCGEYDETSDHVFVSCHYSQMVWQNLAPWCRIQPVIAFGIKDLLSLHASSSGPKRRKAIHAIILVAFWSIWKMRNDVVFRQAVPNSTRTLDEIKSMAFLWVKNRSKAASLTWEDWSRFNLVAM
ncbi:putative reverse transcriptase zinc-binding domain-containing protein [Helianthus annuus]|nr:putative reverse transcriptase zinc-binding domain-containing protein [Helianthus annuus]